MVSKIRKNQKGFTLVEVIVVAVIVAVLAAVAIPLYIGYIKDANKQAATNAAGSAASYLASARNAGDTTLTPACTDAAVNWTFKSPATQTDVNFTGPTGVTFTVTGTMAAGGTVLAKKGGQSPDSTMKW